MVFAGDRSNRVLRSTTGDRRRSTRGAAGRWPVGGVESSSGILRLGAEGDT